MGEILMRLPNRHQTQLIMFAGAVLLLSSLVGCEPSRGDLVSQDNILLHADDREVALPEITRRAQEAGYLICPSIPSSDVLHLPAPYDEELGDCALIGKSAEIGRWLRLLENIAESCHANREANWADTLAAREDLDSQIDDLQSVVSVSPVELMTDCTSYNGLEPSETMDSSAPSTHRYTNWLKTIGENVVEYCTMIDELVEPLWRACDEINFYQDCQVPDRQQYHAIVEVNMNAAEIMYDYTDSFYSNDLQTYGFDNFRANFNEAYIDCPDSTGRSMPMFIFTEIASCRFGPDKAYDEIAVIRQNQSALIVGRDQAEPSWWLVLDPATNAKCWVPDTSGSAEGFLEDVRIESPRPGIQSTQDP
jgi:hypothetical protein